MPTQDHIIIAGYGIAGMTAADTLRAEGFTGRLTIIGAEASEPYSRPALSKAMMSAEADPQPQFLPPATHGAEILLGRRTTGLDRDARTITLDDGSTHRFDGLVIATGSSPRRFTDDPRELVVRGAEDAAALRMRLTSRPRVVVIGGGALGMEVASGARDLDCAVTLVHRGPPMAGHLGPYLSRLCCEAARDRGVTLIDGSVEAVSAPADPQGALTVRLTGGDEITADIVISAVGDAPADDWLAGSGLLTDGRLLVDDRGRVITGVHDDATGTVADSVAGAAGLVAASLVADGIVAAGDIAWLPDSRGHCRQPLWTAAIEQARTAARALLHGDAAPPLDFVPYFWTEQFGLNIRVSGDFPIAGEPEIVDHGQTRNPDALLLRWSENGSRSAAAVGYRIPIPRLRKVAHGLLPSA